MDDWSHGQERVTAVIGGVFGVLVTAAGVDALLTGEVSTRRGGLVRGEEVLWMGGVLLALGVLMIVCCGLYWWQQRH